MVDILPPFNIDCLGRVYRKIVIQDYYGNIKALLNINNRNSGKLLNIVRLVCSSVINSLFR